MAAPRKTTAKSTTEVTASFELITPALAAQYLETNVGNQRKISVLAAGRYISSMKKGLWRVNGEAIKFDTNGALCDGQHRLTACINSDCSFETLVIRGLDPSVFDSLDTGKQRSAGDVLRTMGVKSYASVSSAVRVWAVMERLRDQDVYWEIKPNALGIDNHIIKEVYEAATRADGDNHWEMSAQTVIRDYLRFARLVGPATAVFVYHFLTHIDHERALTYIKGLDTGMAQLRDRSRNKFCPSALVKEKLVDIRLKSGTKKHYHRLLAHEKLAYIFEGWNYFVEDKCMNQLSKSVDGVLPVVENSPIIRSLDNFGRLI